MKNPPLSLLSSPLSSLRIKAHPPDIAQNAEVMRWFIPLLITVSLARTDDIRIDCYPEPDANEQKCKNRDCIWKSGDSLPGIPWCYMKPGVGYKQASKQDSKITLRKNNGPKNPWGADFREIYFKSSFIGKTLNVKIYAENRYEPPIPLPRQPTESSDELQ
ncbi:hypothetical protein Y032_0358g3398, partial [Ancylostoma ceylanicum]